MTSFHQFNAIVSPVSLDTYDSKAMLAAKYANLLLGGEIHDSDEKRRA
jgi:hypothetical protein